MVNRPVENRIKEIYYFQECQKVDAFLIIYDMRKCIISTISEQLSNTFYIIKNVSNFGFF